MRYTIKNDKGTYVRLDSNGRPATCGEKEKGMFEFQKAKNILDNLPKILKRMEFKLEAVPSPEKREEKDGLPNDGGFLEGNAYKIPDAVSRWADKFGEYEKIAEEARGRMKELDEMYSENKRMILDVRHRIELESNKDLYGGWLLYVELRTLLRKRRDIKDERMIICDAMRMKVSKVSSKEIKKRIDGLAERKYTFRIDGLNKKR